MDLSKKTTPGALLPSPPGSVMAGCLSVHRQQERAAMKAERLLFLSQNPGTALPAGAPKLVNDGLCPRPAGCSQRCTRGRGRVSRISGPAPVRLAPNVFLNSSMIFPPSAITPPPFRFLCYSAVFPPNPASKVTFFLCPHRGAKNPPGSLPGGPLWDFAHRCSSSMALW